MNLINYTIDELENEIEIRDETKKKAPLFRSDVTIIEVYHALGNMAKDVVENLPKKGFYDDDIRQYMFETVMELFYGKDYFKWHNQIVK